MTQIFRKLVQSNLEILNLFVQDLLKFSVKLRFSNGFLPRFEWEPFFKFTYDFQGIKIWKDSESRGSALLLFDHERL